MTKFIKKFLCLLIAFSLLILSICPASSVQENNNKAGVLMTLCKNDAPAFITFFRKIINVFKADEQKLVVGIHLEYLVLEDEFFTVYTDQELTDRVAVLFQPYDFFGEIKVADKGFSQEWYSFNENNGKYTELYYPEGRNIPCTSTPQTPGKYCCIVKSDDGGYKDSMFVQVKERGTDRELYVTGYCFDQLGRLGHQFTLSNNVLTEDYLMSYYTSGIFSNYSECRYLKVRDYDFDENGELLLPDDLTYLDVVFLKKNEYQLGFVERFGNIPDSWNLIKYDGGTMTVCVKNNEAEKLPDDLKDKKVERLIIKNADLICSQQYFEKYFEEHEITEISLSGYLFENNLEVYKSVDTININVGVFNDIDNLNISIDSENQGLIIKVSGSSADIESLDNINIINSEKYDIEQHQASDYVYLAVNPK